MEPESKNHHKEFTFSVLLLGLVVFAVLMLSGYAFYDQGYRIDRILEDTCREIEDLKTLERDRAERAYARLDQTLRFLEVERSPEVERAAKELRDIVLREFAARPCPREDVDANPAP